MVSPETNDFAEMIYYVATKKNKHASLISINNVHSYKFFFCMIHEHIRFFNCIFSRNPIFPIFLSET